MRAHSRPSGGLGRLGLAVAAALAHGFGGGRADLPISKTLFIYGATGASAYGHR